MWAASGATSKRAPGDGVGDEPAVLWRGGGVLGARDDEVRGFYGRQPVAEVHVPDGRAATGVAPWVRLAQDAGHLLHGLGVLRAEGGGEPAFDHAVNEGGHAPPRRGRYALVPDRLWAEQGRGAEEDEAFDPLGCLGREPHPGHAAYGEAAERGTPYSETVEEVNHVPPKVPYLVRAGRRGRPPVPPGVLAEQPEPLPQRGRLGVPHLHRRSEGVGEDEDRRVLGPLDQVVQVRGVSIGQGALSARWSSRARSTNVPADPR